MAEKCVLYFSGGTMAGVFGAGVGAGLIERNFDDHVEAIYGGSAGAFNAAYFLTRQNFMGPSIYYEDLVEDFILARNIPFGVFQRFCLRYFGIYPGKLRQAVNIDLLMDIVANKKILDLEKLKKSPNPIYVKVRDVKNKKWAFIDLRTYHNPLQLLKASVSVVPYFLSSENIDNLECIDHCLADPLTLDFIVARHPDSKIVFVVNYVEKMRLLRPVAMFLEGVVANWCFPELERTCFIKGMKKFEQDVKRIKKDPNMLLITPPEHVSITGYETDPVKLIKIYEAGKVEANKIVDFLRDRV